MADKELLNVTLLDGTNFPLWKFGVVPILKSKGLMGYVDDTEPKPDEKNEKAEYANWVKNSAKAETVIICTVDKKLHRCLLNCVGPAEMWNKLVSLYSNTSENVKQAAWHEFYTFKIKDGESIAFQIEEFETSISKLKNADEKISETAIIARLLDSLSPKFSNFKMAWECTPAESQEKDKLIARLIKEDRRLSEIEDATSTMVALQVDSSKDKNKKGNSNKNKKQANKKRIEELKKKTNCKYCSEKGHWVRECPVKLEDEKNKSNHNNKAAESFYCDLTALCSMSKEHDNAIWIADSGASMHMTFRKDFFHDIQPVSKDRFVRVADDKTLPIAGMGTIRICETLDNKILYREMYDVLYVPDLKRNLFSICAINDKGFSFHTYKKKCEIRNNEDKIVSAGIRYGKLFKMNFSVVISDEANIAEVSSPLILWHERFGHINFQAVKYTSQVFDLDKGIQKNFEKSGKPFCETCVMSKQVRKPRKTVIRSNKYEAGEKIHTDVCGPISVESIKGAKYFLIFKDENSSFRKIYFMRQKSEVFGHFKTFESLISTQLSRKIKVLRSDNGTEYLSLEFQNFCKEKGIIHERSAPYIHEQNGKAEREIRTLINLARSMMIAKNVPKYLWAEAVNTACYLLNRSVLNANEDKTPFEKFFKRKPEVQHLRIFGADAYESISKEKANRSKFKFDARSKKMILVGYDGESSNYKLYDLKNRSMWISSDVEFNESSVITVDQQSNDCKIDIDFGESDSNEIQNMNDSDTTSDADTEYEDAEDPNNNPGNNDNENQRVLRNRNNLQPIDRYGIPVAHLAEVIAMNYHEAISGADAIKWRKAMSEELQALDKNKTWFITTLPHGKKTIGCKWVYSIKSDAKGIITRYKARLVAKGFTQRHGIDYFETSSPVVRYESIRILLAIAADKDYEISKFDVKTAFLNGDLQEDIYMEIPDGFDINIKENSVLKLNKSLYGLKQSSRCWNEKFVKFLKDFNLNDIQSEKCVFTGIVLGYKVFLAIYVDDGLIMSENKASILAVLNYLEKHFEITTDEANEFLGMELLRDRKKRFLKISQAGYITKILEKFNMLDANPVSVPAEPGLYLQKCNKDIKKILPYREIIGSLLFVSRICRPDIEFAVNYASQFLDSHDSEHFNAVKRILRYLKGTINYGIIFQSNRDEVKIQGFTDSDYAGCLESRKSRTGYVFLLNNAPISWASQKQEIVSLSTAEAEYVALTHGIKEAIWLKRMLNDLKIECNHVPIFVDNQSAMRIAENTEFHKRSKHIDVRFHFIRDIVKKKEISLCYVNTKEQLADIFTKPLAKQTFQYLRGKLRILDNTN